MKKIDMSRIAEVMSEQRKATLAQEAFVPSPAEAQAPPLPAHIGQVTPPSNPEEELPATFEGFVELAKLVAKRQGPVEKSMLWAALAQAMATKQVADRLEALRVFLGGGDGTGGENEPRFSHTITDGLVDVAMVANDELLPEGAIDILKAGMAARIAEEMGK